MFEALSPGDERSDELEHPLDREPLDRDEAAADEALSRASTTNMPSAKW